MFKLLVLSALVAVTAAAVSQRQLDIEKTIFREGIALEAEEMMSLMEELKHIYENTPQAPVKDGNLTIVDKWMRTLLDILFKVSEIKKENCGSLSTYNDIADLCKAYDSLKSATKFIDHYQGEQNKLCQQLEI